MKKERPKTPRIIWFRPDFDGAALHGFRRTGDGADKKGKPVRIYTSLCGAIVLHRSERLPSQHVLHVARVYDSGVCTECQRKRLEGPAPG